MTDDFARQPQEASRISLTENWEVRYWTQKFGCSEAELKRALMKVGYSVEAVRRQLMG